METQTNELPKSFHYMWDIKIGLVGHIVNYNDGLEILRALGERKMTYAPYDSIGRKAYEKSANEIAADLENLPVHNSCNYKTRIFSRVPKELSFTIGKGFCLGYNVKGDFSKHKIKSLFSNLKYFLKGGNE